MHICPRCESNRSEVVTRSPVKGAWEVLLCPVCLFTWRTSEPDSITDPAKYKSAFKVNPKIFRMLLMFLLFQSGYRVVRK